MYIDIGGLNIYYDKSGEGEPVLILHGWGADSSSMRPVADAVTTLNMQAVLMDFPGFGKSDEPKEPMGVPEYARLTLEFMQRMGLTGADVICHSFGGRIVIYLASENDKLFNRITMVDAAGIRNKRGPKWYARTIAYKLGKKLKQIPMLDKAFKLSEKQKKAGSEDYRALKSDIMRAVFVKTVNLDLSNRLSKISRPTLLIWGELDDATPLYMAKIMKKRIKDAGLVVLKGAGHFSYIDRYAQFCAVLRAFLSAS